MSNLNRFWKVSSFQILFLIQSLLNISFAQLVFPSSYIKIPDADLTFYFEYNEANQTVLMGLDIDKSVNYFSIGFGDEGNYGMISFDMVAFVFVPNNQSEGTFSVNTMDLYSSKNSRPPSDAALGGTSDYQLIDYYAVGQKRQVLFERPWDTKDKYDYVLNPDSTKFSVVFTWAWVQNGKHSMSYHGKTCGTVISKMYNGFQGEAKPYSPGILSPRLVLTIHGYVMLFGWLILSEFALQIARYKKFSKNYMTIHLWLMISLYILTLVSVGFALYVRWGSVAGTASLIHFYLSWILVALLTIQATFGSFLGIKIKREKKTASIPSLTKFHWVLGTIIDIIVKIQTANGLYMFNDDYMIYLYAYYGFLIVLRGYQEYSYRFKNQIKGHKKLIDKKEDSKIENHQMLIRLLNNNTPISDILSMPELKALKWAILDDKVFEFKDFTHPGGNFILNFIIGQEIGRYIYGSYGLTIFPEATQHAHTKDTLKILKKNFIGGIQTNHQIFMPNYNIIEDPSFCNSLSEQTLDGLNGSVASVVLQNSNKEKLLAFQKEEKVWILESKNKITSFISQFEFKCKNYCINPLYQDIKHIGRHVKVSHTSMSKIRLYTLVFSQTKVKIKRREQLWNKFQNKTEIANDFPNLIQVDTFPLIIKSYENQNQSTFSGLLHNSEIGTDGFTIEGPFGPGLGLTLESKGIHYIFAAGTGILPFLDLFDFLFEKLLESDIKILGMFESGFNLNVFASFAQIKDFVGLEICEKLIQICEAKRLKNAFNLTVKASDIVSGNEMYQVTDSIFDNAFIEKNVIRECEKAYICGPPQFNSSILGSLETMGLSKYQTILV